MTPALDLDAITLEAGSHMSPDDGFCVMEAVAYVAGDPWSDHPPCASTVIGAFLRSWNDSMSDEDRQKLKPYIPQLVGTATTAEDEEIRAWLTTDWLVRTFTPAWLRKAGLDERAAELEALDELTSSELAKVAQPIIEKARKEAAAAGAAAWAAARNAAGDAARAAAGAAARNAAGAAAKDAAWAAVWNAAWNAARAAAWNAAVDAAWNAAVDAAWNAARAAAGAAARAAARAAADEALEDTVVALQASAFDLLDRMIDVGKAR